MSDGTCPNCKVKLNPPDIPESRNVEKNTHIPSQPKYEESAHPCSLCGAQAKPSNYSLIQMTEITAADIDQNYEYTLNFGHHLIVATACKDCVDARQVRTRVACGCASMLCAILILITLYAHVADGVNPLKTSAIGLLILGIPICGYSLWVALFWNSNDYWVKATLAKAHTKVCDQLSAYLLKQEKNRK